MVIAEHIERSYICEAEQYFTSVYERYTLKMWDYAFKLSKSEQEANDLVQEVFLKVWEGLARFRCIENQLSYLYSMIRNRYFNMQKSLQRKQAGVARYRNYYSAIDHHDTVLLKDYYQVFVDAVSKLPPRQMQVFLLKEKGYKRKTVSAGLQISANTVDNNLMLAWLFVRGYVGKKLVLRTPVDCIEAVEASLFKKNGGQRLHR